MATPLIRIPQEQGGTLYAFSSAARDLTRAYYNPDIVFEYSKFALLDLPPVGESSGSDNLIQFDNLFMSSGGAVQLDGNANVDFANSFQNYALNFENLILNDDDFDESLLSSDSENIFFKWLNHLGAFKLRNATTQEAESGNFRLIEEDDSEQTGVEYSKVVKYVGSIDVSNDKNYKGDTYNEIFINVPSSVGYTPNVLFKTKNWNTTASEYLPNLEINGRSGQIHPDSNLNINALADNSDGTIKFDINEDYAYGIEWDVNKYSKIVNNPSLNNLLEYSQNGGDFRFNAVAVYYDVHSKSNPNNRSTNLYGILILDNWKDDPNSTGWVIPEITKYKPNEVTGLNGNAFALKLNVKFNSSLDNVGIEKNINDFTTFSMDVFFDTTSALESASRILADANKKHSEVQNRLNQLEQIFLTSVQEENFSQRLNEVENSLEKASLNFSDSGSILKLISSTNNRINQIISGEIPTELQYNTDVIAGGSGIVIDKSNPSKITIQNKNWGYNLNELFSYDFNTDTVSNKIDSSNKINPTLTTSLGAWTKVKSYENLVRMYIDTNEALENDLNIYLDDSVNGFKVGQVIKISFRNAIKSLNNKSIKIYTDKKNNWIQKASISAADLVSNKPYIELICVDEINKIFELDIIR